MINDKRLTFCESWGWTGNLRAESSYWFLFERWMTSSSIVQHFISWTQAPLFLISVDDELAHHISVQLAISQLRSILVYFFSLETSKWLARYTIYLLKFTHFIVYVFTGILKKQRKQLKRYFLGHNSKTFYVSAHVGVLIEMCFHGWILLSMLCSVFSSIFFILHTYDQ